VSSGTNARLAQALNARRPESFVEMK